jgi:hypothetical protein
VNGLRQDCPLSPLFMIYVVDVDEMLRKAQVEGRDRDGQGESVD